MFYNLYRLNQSRKVLQSSYKAYHNSYHKVSDGVRQEWKTKLLDLQDTIDRGDRREAKVKANDLEAFTKKHHKKSWIKWPFEMAFALAVALIAATVIRQMWFELYEIPTGSMRPTFKEQDHLTVSKTQFGINVPLQTEHFYFDPNLLVRANTLIFSGDGLPLRDTDTTFLGVFPYKKRYVKRLIGLPEDQLYFYGGKVYGFDREGKEIPELLNSPWLEKLDHIPFLQFADQVERGNKNTYTLYYFHQPYARVSQQADGTLYGEVFDGKKWVQDDITSLKKPHSSVKTLSDIFGMRNFAIAQLYTKKELENESLKTDQDTPLYLVLRHTPHVDYTKGQSFSPRFPKVMTTTIPLDDQAIKTLMDHLYTARFEVQNGKAKRYSLEKLPFTNASPTLTVPDGTYEFYYGKAYSVGFGGTTSELPLDHPIYKKENLQTLFNLGLNWDTAFEPRKGHGQLANRYAYFKEGDLYVMGAPLFKKGDPALESFNQSEKKLEEESTAKNPYFAFKDQHPPKAETIEQFGLSIPKRTYLVLGDNHAMSGDSRIFGFVPEENLQGVPDIILWPFGDRTGKPAQAPYPLFVTPRLIVWGLALIAAVASYWIYWYRLRRRIVL